MRSSGCRAALRRSRPPGRAAIPGAPARAASGGQSSQAPVSGFAWPAARRVRSTRRVMEEAERASVRPRSGFGKMSPQSANGWRGFDRPASRPERRESAIPASTAAFRHVVFGRFAGPRPCRHADMRMRIARWRLVGVRGLRDVWRHRAAEIMQCVSCPCNPCNPVPVIPVIPVPVIHVAVLTYLTFGVRSSTTVTPQPRRRLRPGDQPCPPCPPMPGPPMDGTTGTARQPFQP